MSTSNTEDDAPLSLTDWLVGLVLAALIFLGFGSCGYLTIEKLGTVRGVLVVIAVLAVVYTAFRILRKLIR